MPVYEGMVFIEVTDEHETGFYYFSLQARKTSKKVVQELLQGDHSKANREVDSNAD